MKYINTTKQSLELASTLIARYASDVLSIVELQNVLKDKEDTYISTMTLAKRLKKNNLPYREGRGTPQKLLFNPFELGNVDNEYWLGFFLADGNLPKKAVGVISLFNNELTFLRMFHLHCQVRLSEYIRIASGAANMMLFFGSKQVFQYLSDLGICSDKRYSGDYKVDISWPLLRGLFDGDGCVTKRHGQCRFKITSGNKMLVDKLVSFLTKEGFKTSIVIKGRAYDLYILGGKLGQSRFAELMYASGKFHNHYKFIKAGALLPQGSRLNRLKCWNSLRAQLTTTYPEMEDVNV